MTDGASTDESDPLVTVHSNVRSTPEAFIVKLASEPVMIPVPGLTLISSTSRVEAGWTQAVSTPKKKIIRKKLCMCFE